MPYLSEFLTVATIHFLAVVSPGPDFIMVTRNTLVHSRKAGIYSAIGLGIGIGVHVAYSLLGIALLISQSEIVFNVIKYAGALYLLYLGGLSLFSKSSRINLPQEKHSHDLAPLKALQMGFITNVTNPKATLFFLALFTQIISPQTPHIIQVAYGVEMMIVTSLWFMFVAYIFSIHVVRKGFEKVGHIAERVMGIALIGLALKIAVSSK